MKILGKVTLLTLLLLLGGCAHYAGYSSGYSGAGAYGFGVNSYVPYSSYPVHYDHDVYLHKPHKIHRKKHYYNNNQNHYSHKSRPYVNKQYSKHKHNKRAKHYAHRGATDRPYSHSRHSQNTKYSDYPSRRARPGNKKRNRGDKGSRKHYYRN